MADFTALSTGTAYATLLPQISSRDLDLATMLDPAYSTPTNLPTNSQRLNSASGKFERFNGTSWVDALSSFNLTGAMAVTGTFTASGNLFGSFVTATADTGRFATGSIRFVAPNGIAIMPSGTLQTNDAIRLYNVNNAAGTNVGWIGLGWNSATNFYIGPGGAGTGSVPNKLSIQMSTIISSGGSFSVGSYIGSTYSSEIDSSGTGGAALYVQRTAATVFQLNQDGVGGTYYNAGGTGGSIAHYWQLGGITVMTLSSPKLSLNGARVYAGSYGGGAVTSNFGAGDGALASNTTGVACAAVGNFALNDNTTGNYNAAFGYSSLVTNTTGSSNTGFGTYTLSNNVSGVHNTAVGYSALNSNTTSYNSAFGSLALASNTTGGSNSAFGYITLNVNTTGGSNSAFGYAALQNNTVSNNTAFGSYALQANTTGTPNCAFGSSALTANTTGNDNNAFGASALVSNTTGGSNNAFGTSALHNNTTGPSNCAFGDSALVANVNGGYNIGIGGSALSANTAGSSNVAIGHNALQASTASNNTAVGYQALVGNTTGTPNTAVGNAALISNTTGSFNTAVGYQALYTVSTGSNNAAFGDQSLIAATGSNNTGLGHGAGSNITTGTNNTVIGYAAQASSVSVNNEITLGNSSITTLRCQVTSITSLSDARDKTDIKPLEVGLNLLRKINPVSFTWNTRDKAKIGIKDSGFIAQELKAAQEDLKCEEILQLVYEENPEKLEASYGRLIPVLVKAIQELDERLNKLIKLTVPRHLQYQYDLD
jgi:hypothetical protein